MKKLSIVLLTLCVVVMCANAAQAAGGSSMVSYFKLVLQPILSLGIVILMIYGCFWAYSKMNKYNFKKFSNSNDKMIELSQLSLISHLPLGQNKSINVVEINKKYLVLGVTAEHISLLKEFDTLEDIKHIQEKIEDTEISGNINVAPVVENPGGGDNKIDEICKKYI